MNGNGYINVLNKQPLEAKYAFGIFFEIFHLIYVQGINNILYKLCI